MKRFLAIMAVATAALVSAAPAGASGPAAPGKDVLAINCGDGVGPLTVTIQRGENANGTGQIVGAKGHGIPTMFTFTITDVTTSTVIDSEVTAVGHGHAHPNQSTTTCTFNAFSGTAAEVFGSDLPPGVSATDIVSGDGSVDVIIKL
jgi:hypothetical protein